MRRAACIAALLTACVGRASADELHLLPRPLHVDLRACRGSQDAVPRTLSTRFDGAALEEITQRWRALAIGTPVRAPHADVTVAFAAMAPQAYRLDTSVHPIRVEAGDDDGVFYAAMTLAQLPVRRADGWRMPCVRIEDEPALRWRVLSDDVSRGPLPTMRYFEERIRTIAAFKMNGYSPYMEHVFAVASDPLPAPFDGITAGQLRALDLYARRFHVRLIPEQQTFAHMHNTLAYEQYASDAEEPHGFLLSPSAPGALAYAQRMVAAVLRAVAHPPFVHIGSDETATLGLGQSRALVAARGRAAVFADHVRALDRTIAPSGARTMLWDDAIEQDASIMPLLPKKTVIVNWHYGTEKTFRPYIALVARGGFEQMVAPGARNWNEIFPNVDAAIANERQFIADGKGAHVLGLFQTVWNDDGETLFESTWYPVLYAAADAWERDDLAPARFARDLPFAFFGVDDAGYARDVADLGHALTLLESHPYDTTDRLFWSDTFDAAAGARMAQVDLHTVRLDAEAVETHLDRAVPPLHAAAARAMLLAARRYDVLGRKFQIATEIAAMYADAQAHVTEASGPALRDLFWCKYWMWELRDDDEQLADLYARAWRYENRASHLASVLERYHLAAQRAIWLADAIDRATYEDFVRNHTLPPLDELTR